MTTLEGELWRQHVFLFWGEREVLAIVSPLMLGSSVQRCGITVSPLTSLVEASDFIETGTEWRIDWHPALRRNKGIYS